MAQGTEPGGTGEPARSGLMSRLRGEGGRSSFVYVVIGVVALTLTVLLAIIYFSASERDRLSPPICTDITLDRAEQAVLQGRVQRLTIVYDETPRTPTSDRYGPVLAKLDNTDGSCSNLPQGVANQVVVYTLTGVIAFYNENTEGQTVEIIYQKSEQLGEDLFRRPTAVPTETATPRATEPPKATAPVIVPPQLPIATATPAVTPTERPTEAPASPVASPAATPAPRS
jgi:hypothetical protein